jgi:hypothetical protein
MSGPTPIRTERDRRRRLARLSSARHSKFGALPDDAALWWQQLQAVAADLGIAVTWDDVQAPVINSDGVTARKPRLFRRRETDHDDKGRLGEGKPPPRSDRRHS